MELFLPLHQDKPHELVVIELQGSLECDDGVFSGQHLGKFTYANSSDSGNPELIIGNHRLEGKLVKMSKPFAVLEKTQRAVDVGVDPVEWRVRGIVKYKYMFKTRPQNLV
ncbi:chromosome transmission fidelity protein 8 [Catenaria anguillulae PL171]|uniref:Chromosome transmission fidelity protein 8 n=1 Tax=Catenaria anguillulae PL171 TaxID=765915 RepID=A0A1Y2HUE0_9FUNG|nr:chromosome transmission fidelity protein 8 [Catenaria anguillulae PL171]